ncbi:6-phosphofructokinase [bacterium]|nr:6-phosphofructokinase [bacterium]
MAYFNRYKGTIGILTGGGDVPGLNPAIRGVTMRAIRNGYRVIGLRRGWAGITELNRKFLSSTDPEWLSERSNYYIELNEEIVSRMAREGGTFLHTSRTKPSKMAVDEIPYHLRDIYKDEIKKEHARRDELQDALKSGDAERIKAAEAKQPIKVDLTRHVIENLEALGIDTLIPIGGDDTLSYGHRLYKENVNVVAIPKTMDNDVPGTDYCIGFSTCVSRTIRLANELRTATASHERILVMEVLGRNAGFTAMLPTMAGAATRCLIPEYPFDIEHVCRLALDDRKKNPSNYASILVSEGAMIKGGSIIESGEADAFGHRRLGGIGAEVVRQMKAMIPEMNNGKKVNFIEQKLGYTTRCGNPDAIDSIVPMAYGNLAMELILNKQFGKLVVLKDGRYSHVDLDVLVSGEKAKRVDVDTFYVKERLRPNYERIQDMPLFIMTNGVF